MNEVQLAELLQQIQITKYETVLRDHSNRVSVFKQDLQDSSCNLRFSLYGLIDVSITGKHQGS